MVRGTLVRGCAALAALAALAVGPSSDLRAQDRDERATRYLVGDGFELHGRLDAAWVGAADAPFLTALRDLARDVAPRGLDLRVTRVANLGDVGDADLVVVGDPIAVAGSSRSQRPSSLGSGYPAMTAPSAAPGSGS